MAGEAELFTALFERARLGVIVCRLDDLGDPRTLRLVSANAAARALLGEAIVAANRQLFHEIFTGVGDLELRRYARCASLAESVCGIGSQCGSLPDPHRLPLFAILALPERHLAIVFTAVDAGEEVTADLGASESATPDGQREGTSDLNGRGPDGDESIDRRSAAER